jgi:histidine ammonia-lyase
VSGWIWRLMQGSPIRRAHAEREVDWEVQDPYSLRCAGQILGACHELIADARRTLEIEASSATDNPLVLADPDGRHTRIVSGGHFHGMPVAVRLYGLLEAAAIIAHLSNVRSARFVDEDRNRGLGADLIWPGLDAADRAASSGMMIPEYVTAALANAVWGALAPSHLHSIPTDAGQEDHVSMSAGLAVRLWDALPRVAEALAIELAFGSQAAAIRERSEVMTTKRDLSESEREAVRADAERFAEAVRAALADSGYEVEVGVRMTRRWPPANRSLSPPCAAAVAAVRKALPVVEEDRSLSGEIAALARRVASGEVLRAAEEVTPLEA